MYFIQLLTVFLSICTYCAMSSVTTEDEFGEYQPQNPFLNQNTFLLPEFGQFNGFDGMCNPFLITGPPSYPLDRVCSYWGADFDIDLSPPQNDIHFITDGDGSLLGRSIKIKCMIREIRKRLGDKSAKILDDVCYHAKYKVFKTNEKPSLLLLTVIDQIQLATNHEEKVMAEICPKYFKKSNKRTRRAASLEPKKSSNDLSDFDISEFENIQQLHRAIMLNDAKIEKPPSNVKLEDIANVNRYDSVNKQQFLQTDLRNPSIIQNPYGLPFFPPISGPISNGLRSGPPNLQYPQNTQGKFPAINKFNPKPPQQNQNTASDDDLKGVEIVASPGPPDGYPGGFPGSILGGFPGGSPGGFPGSSPGGFPGGSPGGFPGSNPGGFPGSNPGGFPGSSPGGFPGSSPGGFPGSSPGSFPVGFPSEKPGGFPNEYPGSFPSEYPGGFPGGYPDSFPPASYPSFGDAFSPGVYPGDQLGNYNYFPGEYQPQNPFLNQNTFLLPEFGQFNGFDGMYNPFLITGPPSYPLGQYPYPLLGQQIPHQPIDFGFGQQPFMLQQQLSFGHMTNQPSTSKQPTSQVGSEHAPPYKPKQSTTIPSKKTP